MSKKTILAVYEDPDTTIDSVKHLRAKGLKIREVYTPFPVHGLDAALGLAKTRISTAAFFYGALGTSLALLMIWYMNISDWPMDIGGKPSFSLWQNIPAFIPVTFEITVLIAAHLMIGTFFFRSRLFPGLPALNPDPRSTDDKFVMEVVLDDNNGMNEDQIKSLLSETTPSEINDSHLRYND